MEDDVKGKYVVEQNVFNILREGMLEGDGVPSENSNFKRIEKDGKTLFLFYIQHFALYIIYAKDK